MLLQFKAIKCDDDGDGDADATQLDSTRLDSGVIKDDIKHVFVAMAMGIPNCISGCVCERALLRAIAWLMARPKVA